MGKYFGTDGFRGEANKNLTFEHAILIGDRKFDIEAAKGAGIASMGVTYGFAPPGELEAAGAEAIVETPGEIIRIIKTV